MLFIECIGADAWPILACPEFAGTDTGAENHDDQNHEGAQWYHNRDAVFDGRTTLRATAPGNEAVELSWPATDARGTAMMGDGVSDRPRMEVAPVRMPLPRASAEGLPGGGIYSLHTLLHNKSFGDAKL